MLWGSYGQKLLYKVYGYSQSETRFKNIRQNNIEEHLMIGLQIGFTEITLGGSL